MSVKSPRPEPAKIDAAFRNGSITAISVLVGFSLSFLPRWAALPGPWGRTDLVAVSGIAIGIVLEILATGMLLSIRSLETARYNRALAIFLVGLGFVAAGVAIAIVGDVVGVKQQVIGEAVAGRGPGAERTS